MKYFKYVVLIFLVVLVCGCSKKTTKTCTIVSDQSTNGYKDTIKYTIYAKGDTVYKLEQNEVIDSDKKDIIDFYKKEFNSMYKKYNKTYGGYTYNIDTKSNKVILDVAIDYKKFNTKMYIEDNTGLKRYTNNKNQFTFEGMTKMYENLGATCK